MLPHSKNTCDDSGRQTCSVLGFGSISKIDRRAPVLGDLKLQSIERHLMRIDMFQLTSWDLRGREVHVDGERLSVIVHEGFSFHSEVWTSNSYLCCAQEQRLVEVHETASRGHGEPCEESFHDVTEQIRSANRSLRLYGCAGSRCP